MIPKFYIAHAACRTAKVWSNAQMAWEEFALRCSQCVSTPESRAQWEMMSRDAQSQAKDVGGFVGARLSQGRRTADAVEYRTLVTLDFDYDAKGVWERLEQAYPGKAAVCYSTHSHTPEHPRLRVVMPLAKGVMPQMYEPMARQVASALGIEAADPTTYDTNRLFFWPSKSCDAEFYYRRQDGDALDPGALLGSYADWRDPSQWPRSERESSQPQLRERGRSVQDPTEKEGEIGAFCREYPISRAISEFLQAEYSPAGRGRYTYSGGSTSGGLMVEGDKLAYTFHATDPAAGGRRNSFDLVRLHRFGYMDAGWAGDGEAPSCKAMREWAATLEPVRVRMIAENREKAKALFSGVEDEEPSAEGPGKAKKPKKGNGKEPVKEQWMARLKTKKGGAPMSTMENMALVLGNDSALKGRLWKNAFDGFFYHDSGLPWGDGKAGQWTDADDASMRSYLESAYGFEGKEKMRDAALIVFSENSRHPVMDYLTSLHWDGVERLDTALCRHMGAEDCEYTRAVTRKFFCAAVARIMRPGCKFDHCLILHGAQGAGKSSFLRIMAGDWFNDSMQTFEGKEAMEQAQTAWIFEIGELDAMKRSDICAVKNFMTRQSDIFRPAYGRNSEKRERHCVFAATTNEDKFLKDETGNRRFWVVRVNGNLDFDALADERDQLWAEAAYRFAHGEELRLDRETEKVASAVQLMYLDDDSDEIAGQLEGFLETKLPNDWYGYNLQQRRNYFQSTFDQESKGTVVREKFCIMEFAAEYMGRNIATDTNYRYFARRMAKLVRDRFPQWEMIGLSRDCGANYGVQRMYKRKDESDLFE